MLTSTYRFFFFCCIRKIRIKLMLSTSLLNILKHGRHWFFMFVCILIVIKQRRGRKGLKFSGKFTSKRTQIVSHRVIDASIKRRLISKYIEAEELIFPKHYSFFYFVIALYFLYISFIHACFVQLISLPEYLISSLTLGFFSLYFLA